MTWIEADMLGINLTPNRYNALAPDHVMDGQFSHISLLTGLHGWRLNLLISMACIGWHSHKEYCIVTTIQNMAVTYSLTFDKMGKYDTKYNHKRLSANDIHSVNNLCAGITVRSLYLNLNEVTSISMQLWVCHTIYDLFVPQTGL